MSRFSVDFVFPDGFNYLAAEVCCDNQIICRIAIEGGGAELELDLFFEMREPVVPIRVPMAEFIDLVTEVGTELRQARAKFEAEKQL